MLKLGMVSWMALLTVVLSPAAAQAKVVGIGIAKSNSHVYAWFDDGTVSSGTSSNFAFYTHPVAFSLPGNEQPKDILAISIAKNDHVYAWYRDGQVSEGTSGNLGKYKGLTPFKPAAGKSVSDVRAIGISAEDKTYAWYADGTVSVGSSGRLDAYQAPKGVQLPPGKTMAGVVEIDIAPDDRVYSWFSDGSLFIGTSGALAKHGGPSGYRSRAVIQAELKPGLHLVGPHPHPFIVRAESEENEGPIHVLPPGTIGSGPHQGDVSLREVGVKSTAKLTAFNPTPAIGGPDPMLAVSPHFMIISDTGTLVFADRNAVPLKQNPNGLATSMSANQFFQAFFAVDVNGVPTGANINLDTGFPAVCNGASFPPTTGNGFCINEAYDTRVFFDGDSQRFFVLSHVRNPLWVNLSPDYASKNAGSCGYFEGPGPKFEGRSCKLKPDGSAMKCPMVDRTQCALARRHSLIAVSKTEDPRDGFFQFASTENMMADWPWMAINRNRVVVTTMGAVSQPPNALEKHPIVLVFDKSALLAGSTQPPFFTYSQDDLSGENPVNLVTQPGGAGTTLMLRGGSTLRIFGFLNNTTDPWKAPPLIKASIGIDGAPGGFGSVHRNGLLYLVGTKVADSKPNPANPAKPLQRLSVHVVRVPLNRTGNDIVVSKDASAGFLDYFFGRNSPDDPPQSVFSYEQPAIAVNKAGDMLFGYHRLPFPASSTSDARVSFWPAKASAPFASQLLMAGSGAPGGKIDYATAVVDPDDQTFWVAQPFASSGWRTAVGHLTP
jgi:hypothetical protein